jgi:hypothetical protein
VLDGVRRAVDEHQVVRVHGTQARDLAHGQQVPDRGPAAPSETVEPRSVLKPGSEAVLGSAHRRSIADGYPRSATSSGPIARLVW